MKYNKKGITSWIIVANTTTGSSDQVVAMFHKWVKVEVSGSISFLSDDIFY